MLFREKAWANKWFLRLKYLQRFSKKLCKLQDIKVHVCIISFQYLISGTWRKFAKKQLKKELMDEQMLKRSPSSVSDMFSLTRLNRCFKSCSLYITFWELACLFDFSPLFDKGELGVDLLLFLLPLGEQTLRVEQAHQDILQYHPQ